MAFVIYDLVIDFLDMLLLLLGRWLSMRRVVNDGRLLADRVRLIGRVLDPRFSRGDHFLWSLITWWLLWRHIDRCIDG